MVRLVGFTVEIYYDARPYVCQICVIITICLSQQYNNIELTYTTLTVEDSFSACYLLI
jgi:hypothetical protein